MPAGSQKPLSTTLEEDLQRVSSEMATREISCEPDNGGAPFSIRVQPDDEILPSIAKHEHGDGVMAAWWGADEITDRKVTFRDYGIEDGARLTVGRASHRLQDIEAMLGEGHEGCPGLLQMGEFAEAMVACNPHLTVEDLLDPQRVERKRVWSNGAYHYEKKILRWGLRSRMNRGQRKDKLDIHTLPDCFDLLPPDLTLDFSYNKITNIPPSFVNRCITGEDGSKCLRLPQNAITEIPKHLAGVAIDYIDLEGNQINELPAFLASATIGDLNLQDNQIRSVPAEFGNACAIQRIQLDNNPVEGPQIQVNESSDGDDHYSPGWDRYLKGFGRRVRTAHEDGEWNGP